MTTETDTMGPHSIPVRDPGAVIAELRREAEAFKAQAIKWKSAYERELQQRLNAQAQAEAAEGLVEKMLDRILEKLT